MRKIVLSFALLSLLAPILGAADASPLPQIERLSSTEAQIGTTVSLEGSGLGDTGSISIGGVQQNIEQWTHDRVIFGVNPGTNSGPVAVKLSSLPAIEGPTLKILNYSIPSAEVGYIPERVWFRLALAAQVTEVALDNGLQTPVQTLDASDPLLGRWWSAPVPAGSEEETVKALAADARVEWAELHPATQIPHAFTPNDLLYGQQWAPKKIGADRAWLFKRTLPNAVYVAIIDSGFDGFHEDLVGHAWGGRNYTGDGKRADGMTDECGHGTHVAGIASAVTNNGKGVAGGSFGARLKSYKVFRGFNCDWAGSALAQVIRDADADGNDVINMSLGDPCGQPTYIQSVQDAINTAASRGRVMVASAGNCGNTQALYPANYSNVVAVASTNESDQRSSFSTYGSWVDVSAPGDNILSTASIIGNPSFCGGSTYNYCQGTSMAAPQVAGEAAILRECGFTGTTLVDILKANVDPINFQGGTGRISTWRAIASRPECHGNTGVRVASGDVDGDTIADIVTAPGPGGGPHIKVYSADGVERGGFFAYTTGFGGGVWVAVGDVRPDIAGEEIITGADSGGGPHVRVWRWSPSNPNTATELAGWFPFETSFSGGVRVGFGKFGTPASPYVIVAPGSGRAAEVKLFSINTSGAATQALSFLPYGGYPHGAFIAAGNLDGNIAGEERLITGADSGGGPHVQTFKINLCAVCSPSANAEASWFAYESNFSGGVFVSAADIEPTLLGEEIVTTPARNGGPRVRVWDVGVGPNPFISGVRDFMAYDVWFNWGLFNAAGIFAGEGRIVTGPGQNAPNLVRTTTPGAVTRTEWCAYSCA